MTPFWPSHSLDDRPSVVSLVSRDDTRDETPKKSSKTGRLTRDDTRDETLNRLIVSAFPSLRGSR
jgi:hypothetical protein